MNDVTGPVGDVVVEARDDVSASERAYAHDKKRGTDEDNVVARVNGTIRLRPHYGRHDDEHTSRQPQRVGASDSAAGSACSHCRSAIGAVRAVG